MDMKKGLSFAVITLFIGIALASSITTSEPTSNQTVYSDDSGTLSGYVKDTSMNPIEGARVRVYFHETYEENYTDSSGYYHVTNIPICYCLKNATASKEGYTTEWVLLAIGENTTHDFVLTPLSKTLYVGGDGPGNYTRIQDAIDAASDGDKVYVFNGTYYENIIIDKTIILIGEDKNNTIILSNGKEEQIVNISADRVTFKNFSIVNCYFPYPYNRERDVILVSNVKDVVICCNNLNSSHDDLMASIYLVNSNNCTIKKNSINGSTSKHYNDFGIRLWYSNNNTISENTIKYHSESTLSLSHSHSNYLLNNYLSNTNWCIELWYSNKNIIKQNKIKNNDYTGIGIFNSSKNLISENEINNNGEYGIDLFETHQNIITKNDIVSNGCYGIYLSSNGFIYNLLSSHKNRTATLWTTISYNNFIDNTKHASFQSSYCTNWKMNYWGQPRSVPYPIYGKIGPFYKIALPWVQFDWHPAQEPYDIMVGGA